MADRGRPTAAQRRNLADRLIAAGADPAEARKVAGVRDDPAPASKPAAKRERSGSSRRKSSTGRAARSAARRAAAPVRAVGFGTLFAQGLLLVALLWVLRTSALVSVIIDGIDRGLRWLRDPVPIGG